MKAANEVRRHSRSWNGDVSIGSGRKGSVRIGVRRGLLVLAGVALLANPMSVQACPYPASEAAATAEAQRLGVTIVWQTLPPGIAGQFNPQFPLQVILDPSSTSMINPADAVTVVRHEAAHAAVNLTCGTWYPSITGVRAENVTDVYAETYHGYLSYYGYPHIPQDGDIAKLVRGGNCATPPQDMQIGGGSQIPKGQTWYASNGKTELRMQSDGNFVLYGPADPLKGQTFVALWHTSTNGTGADRAIFQSDGNLVVYKGNTPVWNSGTNGTGANAFKVQNDRNLVILASGVPVWNSGTQFRGVGFEETSPVALCDVETETAIRKSLNCNSEADSDNLAKLVAASTNNGVIESFPEHDGKR